MEPEAQPVELFCAVWLIDMMICEKTHHFAACHFRKRSFLHDLAIQKFPEHTGDIRIFRR